MRRPWVRVPPPALPVVRPSNDLHSIMEHPKDIADRTTLAVMIAAREAGYAIAVPFGENTRYDLVFDDGRMLSRVQCKTRRLRAGAVIFSTASTYLHHSHPGVSRRPYQGEIDYFAVHCAATGGVYLVPIGHVPTRTTAMLRVEPARNRQRKRIRLARDYQIGAVGLARESVTRALRASSGARGSSA
jgi:hypothetical protein